VDIPISYWFYSDMGDLVVRGDDMLILVMGGEMI
jgi:hypothetical protein